MTYACGITPEKITELNGNDIFVFGSNLLGRHGAGAALTALRWGAQHGVGIGFSGKTYALPTKDELINTMVIDDIRFHVNVLHDMVNEYPEHHYLITKVGCGLAGYTPEQIAPLFADFIGLDNVSLPQEFIDIITKETK